MSEVRNVRFTEERIPLAGVEQTIVELIELYGGTLKGEGANERRFTLPLRRGVAAGGAIECHLTWAAGENGEGSVTLEADRDLDAPRVQRVLMLVAGVLGSLAFLLWPFFPGEKQYGTLAWLGGAIAIAVYLMTLRRTSGGIVWDFLQRLAKVQREGAVQPPR